MTDEPVETRRQRGQALIYLAREDLDLLGVEELNERIELLGAEIARARAQVVKKETTRSAADALFSRKD
jgi:uncharacterized small protein (DUF1192 family)